MASFGVTYEGLKQRHSLRSKIRFSCFGVTYEGLKLQSAYVTEDTAVCFGVTYEGLKQSLSRSRISPTPFWSYL